tara:strand:+ start:417 stop:977 length:561 start_codon:yes stop_codon:yes gene_type:complete
MNKYQNIETNQAMTYAQLKKSLVNCSVPSSGTPIIADVWNLVEKTQIPDSDPYTQGVQESAPVNCVQTWEVFDLEGDKLEIAQKEQRDHDLQLILSDFLTSYSAITEGYSAGEISSWPQQLSEAKDFKASSDAKTELLDSMIVETGESKEQVVEVILAKAKAASSSIGKAIGQRRVAMKKLIAESK